MYQSRVHDVEELLDIWHDLQQSVVDSAVSGERVLLLFVRCSCPVDKSCRSCMNISFRIGGPDGNETLEKKFIAEAAHEGMIHLNGHRYD